MQPIKLPPNPARLIEGLRDTGYDFNTALADIIDNSVDAAATKIDILIQMDLDGEIIVAVSDNGCGMNKDTLLDGMTYGATGHQDPKRLGKFGLGLKTASTAFCRKLTVITRDAPDSPLTKAIWDLDHVAKVGEWELLVGIPNQHEIKMFNETLNNSSGTLVIWDKIDRLLKEYVSPNGNHARKALDKRVELFKDHIAMLYQRFLDTDDNRARNIEIKLNGEIIRHWSPFCEKEPNTELVASETIEVEVNGIETFFTIKAYILPRKEYFSTSEAATKAKISNDYQGIYVYRENRLIHPADWLGMFSKEPHLSLLRVEFSFDHLLDDAFQVDIKKSRILLNEDLRKYILNQFIPAPRNAANERSRIGQRIKAEEKAKGAHEGSNRSIFEKEMDLRSSKIDVVDNKTNEVNVTNKSGTVKLVLKISDATNPNELCVKPVNSISDGLLWQPALIGGHHAVEINTSHPYYHKVYVPNLASDVTIQGMDSLLWALIEAELGTINEKTKMHFEELRFEVSRLLRKLVEDLPEPNLEIEE